MWESGEREYVESARVGRLATADGEGRPHVVTVCFAFDDGDIVSAVDEKPQGVAPTDLRRCRNIRANPRVSLLVDHYTEDWAELGWVQIRGTAAVLGPDDDGRGNGVAALEATYDQYADHDLEGRPLIRIDPGSVRSWGALERPE
jgi:PPOX class probable F420-dependent enzyme